jgi:Pentapeptide repeats (8 copies)
MIIKAAKLQSLWQTLTRVYHRISERSIYIYAQGKIWVADRQLGTATRHAGQRLMAPWHAISWQTLPLPLKFLLGGLVLVVAVLAIWKIPQWQASRWEGRINEAKEIAKLENDARATLVQAIGGAVLFIGLWFTWHNMRLAEKNIQITQETALRTFESTREGQITDRFTKAIAQLGEAGPEKLAIRLGGIYALERIAKDSERDHWPIMEILTAYVREHAPWPPKAIQSLTDDLSPVEKSLTEKDRLSLKPAADIQAILTVLGRRARTYGKGEDQHLNLGSIDLRGANLPGAHLEGADLVGTNLGGAFLRDARLEGALCWDTHLEKAYLPRAHLEGAELDGAHLQGAQLSDANLKWAALGGAHLEEAVLEDAHFEGASFLKAVRFVDHLPAHLEGADLMGAHLEGAIDLTVEQLASVKTLYRAHLDPVLLEQIQQRYPHLLAKPPL